MNVGFFSLLNANPPENVSNVGNFEGGVICDSEQLLNPSIGKIH